MHNRDSLPNTPGLVSYRESREALLVRVRHTLLNDSRVQAAWLFGSLGRGAADSLSDIDLMVVVPDSEIPMTAQGRERWVSGAGEPLLLVEAPQNAPPGGAYVAALYPGEGGPHIVDWYWLPASTARIPAETYLLFDHVGLPHLPTPLTWDYQPVPERTAEEIALGHVGFFWMMLLITAKYAARAPHEERMGLLEYVLDALHKTRAYVAPLSINDATDIPPHPDLPAKVALLRQLAARMDALTLALVARGLPVPEGIMRQVDRYLRLIEIALS